MRISSEIRVEGRPDVVNLNGCRIVTVILEEIRSYVPVEIAEVVGIGKHKAIVVAVELLLSDDSVNSCKTIFYFAFRVVESLGCDDLRSHVEETARGKTRSGCKADYMSVYIFHSFNVLECE